MAVLLGKDAKLYRNTGSYGSPAWNEIPNVKDLSLPFELGEADVSTRGYGSWKARIGTLGDLELTFDTVYDPTDADVTALRDAFFARTIIGMAIMDGDITVSTTKGFRADMQVFGFEQSQNLEDAQRVSVTMRPAYSTNVPASYTVP
jgi:hypothetical protein